MDKIPSLPSSRSAAFADGRPVGTAAEEAIKTILRFIGEDPNRDGLQDTPSRVVKSFAEIYGGYTIDPVAILKQFDGISCNTMVVLDSVEFYSTCEHHLMPFTGTAAIAYIPSSDRVVGVSKLARLVDAYARRLQVQERIGQQVVDALMESLDPKGAACYIEARHFCMCARGVGKQSSVMKTSALRGAFLEEPETRAEFFSMIGK